MIGLCNSLGSCQPSKIIPVPARLVVSLLGSSW